MNQEELIEYFNEVLPELTRGLWNLKKRLGDEWNDVKQDAIIRLLVYNKNKDVNKEFSKGLCFLALKHSAIQYLHHKGKIDWDTESDINRIDSVDELILDDDFIQHHKQKLLELITQEEYDTLMIHQNNIENRMCKSDTRTNNRAYKIRRKIGLVSQLEIELDDKSYVFANLRALCDAFGWSQTLISSKRKKKGNTFNFKGQKITIRTITTLNPTQDEKTNNELA